jgi:methylmalonyl-CoA mutase C-terminal domain/subunit
MALVPRILELLKQQGQDEVHVLLGGIIPDEDVKQLKDMGVAAIFGPGTPTTEIISVVNELTSR